MDDDGPLWSVDSVGNYWLMFPNKHALTIDEIRTIFSEFGYVKNVTQAGNEKGLRFVQFTSLKETERAVECLQDHPTVSLRKHRPQKTNKNKTNQDSNSNVKSDDKLSKKTSAEDGYRKNMFQRKKPLQNKGEQLDSDFTSSQASSRQPNGNTESLLFKKIHNIPHNKVHTNKNDGGPDIFTSNQSLHDSFLSAKSSVSLDSLDTLSSKEKIFAKIKKVCTPPSSQAVSTHNSSFHNDLINNFEDSIVESDDANDVDQIPDLVTKVKLASSYPVLDAEEVIVGNIHPRYGVGYMLHLFENYEPIAISYIKVTSNSELRYCHVYFKNLQDSIDVETQFDKYKLAGRNLIVMRPSSLMEEARLRR